MVILGAKIQIGGYFLRKKIHITNYGPKMNFRIVCGQASVMFGCLPVNVSATSKNKFYFIADWSNWPPARPSSQTLRPPSNRVTRSYLWARETTTEPTSNILPSSFRASIQVTIEVTWPKSCEAPPPSSSPPVWKGRIKGAVQSPLAQAKMV